MRRLSPEAQRRFDETEIRAAKALRIQKMELRAVARAWLDHFAGLDRDPEEADGCWPQACSCGFLELIERTRKALEL